MALHSRYTVLQQKVLDLQNRLDLELVRFGRIGAFVQKALCAHELPILASTIAEAIVDVFEMEFGGLFMVDPDDPARSTMAIHGVPVESQALRGVIEGLAGKPGPFPPFKAQQLDVASLGAMAPQACLGHIVFARIPAHDGRLQAIAFAGNTPPGASYYENPSEPILEIFNVFCRQAGSLMDSLRLMRTLHEKDRFIIESEFARQTSERRKRQAELVARLSMSPALSEGDVGGLAAALTEGVAKEFGIGRVGVWLFEENGDRLVNVDHYDAALGAHSAGAALLEREYREEFAWLRKSAYVDGSDAVNDPRLAGYVKGYLVPHRITAMLDAVIRVGERPLGRLCFEQVATPHTWTEDEIAFACQLADQVALAVSNGWRRAAEARAQAARVQAEASNRAKSEFLANMSHELRTPLNAILGLSEGLLEQTRGPLNERQQQSLRTVEASGRHLLGLINEVLDLARIESGRLEMARERVDARGACEAGLALVREQAAAKGVALELEMREEALWVDADPRRLKQILVNLLGNGVKFTPGGGRVRLTAAAAASGESVAFTVADTGIGIAPEDQGRLFQPFVQLDAGLSRRHEGTGLGLALVRRLVELHGGGIELESAPGRGSRFTVTLPAAAEVAGSAGRTLLARVAETGGDTT